jgi:hypothetical protein
MVKGAKLPEIAPDLNVVVIDKALSGYESASVIDAIQGNDFVVLPIAHDDMGAIIRHTALRKFGESITELTVTDGCRRGAMMHDSIR